MSKKVQYADKKNLVFKVLRGTGLQFGKDADTINLGFKAEF